MSPNQLSRGVPLSVPIQHTSAEIPDPSDPRAVDDDARSLFGGSDIDQEDHRGNRKAEDQVNPGTDPGQASLEIESNQGDQKDLPSSEAFLNIIDSFTTLCAPRIPLWA